jgi:hypothetical protein
MFPEAMFLEAMFPGRRLSSGESKWEKNGFL